MTATFALRRAWWLVVLGAVLGAVVGLLLDLATSGPGTVSSSETLVSGNGTSNASDTYNAEQYVSQRASTYAQFVTSDAVLRPASQELGIAVPELASEVSANVVGSTTVIAIAARGTGPENARRVGQAVTDSFGRAVTVLETPVLGQPPRVSTRVITGPSTPPAIPSDPLLPICGAVVGLLLAGAGVVLCRSQRLRWMVWRVYLWMSAEPQSSPVAPTGRLG